jgi:type I restriction enzyme R subunit
MQRIDKEMSGDARDMFAAFIPDGDVGRFARELPQRLKVDLAGTIQLLHDSNFQDLLANYPRPPRRFVVAPEADDEVSSEWLIRDGAGKEHKPDDYLKLFAEYVQQKSYAQTTTRKTIVPKITSNESARINAWTPPLRGL